jgi:hypothetical protein
MGMAYNFPNFSPFQIASLIIQYLQSNILCLLHVNSEKLNCLCVAGIKQVRLEFIGGNPLWEVYI